MFFFFKQKTAYEMVMSDWSSDVCSSDLDAKPGSRCRGSDRAAGCGNDPGRRKGVEGGRSRQPGRPRSYVACSAQLSTLLNCSHRPSSVGSPSAVPWASVNPAKIQGLPPTPPSTGCFGKVRFRPAGMTVTVRVTSASCGPPTGLSLLRKMIRADRPAMVTPLVKLMRSEEHTSELQSLITISY